MRYLLLAIWKRDYNPLSFEQVNTAAFYVAEGGNITVCPNRGAEVIFNVSDRTRSDLCHNGEGTGDKDATGFLCNSLGTIYEPVSSLSAKNSLTTTCLRGAVLGVGYVLFTNTHYCSVLDYIRHVAAPNLRRRHPSFRIDINFCQHSYILLPQLRLGTSRLCRTSDFFNFNEFQIIQGNYYICHISPARLTHKI